MTIDYSERDRAGEVAFYVLLWKKTGIDLELFDDYWKDVHGPVCARLPGQYQYWQFHVAHNDGGHWSLPDNYVNASSDSEQFDGIAELTFKSEADRQTWFNAAGLLMDDEANLFSKAIGYNTSPGNSITYVDRIYNGSPIGATEVRKYHCSIRKAAGVSTEEFRNYLTEKLAPIFTSYDRLLKFRLHLFDRVDSSRPDAGAVSHNELPEQQYDAAVEVAFANNLDLALFLDSEAYRSAIKDFPKYIKHFKPFPERSAYTFVYDGQITLAGQRSVTVADLINRIGAVNQIKDNIVSLMTGGSASGKILTTEKLPGTNADLVKTLFSRGEAFDSQGFIDLFTDTPVYQFGNWDICFDKAAIKQSTDAFFGMVAALYHEIKMLWEIGEVVFVEMDVIYWRKDGSSVSLPCMDIFRFEGDKVAELRIFMDANPVGDSSIPVANTAAVAIAANRQKVPSPEIMRKFFAEHPEGRRRVKNGFIPKWAIAGPKWSIDGVFENNSVGTPVKSSEKLPGTNADLVKTLFSRGEAFDSQGFIDLFTDTPVYQFGNWDICFDKAAIKQSTDAFFGMVAALYHEIKMLWEIGEVVFVEMDVIYWRKDGSSVSLPCMDIFRFEGNKVAELRIFMDANPVGDSSILVADTAAVAIAANRQKVPSPEIMRKFFSEHPEGRRRVKNGFIPKWAIAGPKWSIDDNSSITIATQDISDDSWNLLKNYLKDLKVEQLLSLLATEKLNNSDRANRVLELL